MFIPQNLKKIITVDEKHTYGSNNTKRSQSISDTNNNVYILKDSVYNIALGWFPNITKAKKI